MVISLILGLAVLDQTSKMLRKKKKKKFSIV